MLSSCQAGLVRTREVDQQGGQGMTCTPSLTHHHISGVITVVQNAQGLLDGIHMLKGPGNRAGWTGGCGDAADHSAQEKQVL